MKSKTQMQKDPGCCEQGIFCCGNDGGLGGGCC